MSESFALPIETKFKNGVRIVTFKKAQREFESAAIFQRRLLSLLIAATPMHARKQHAILAEAWGLVSESNLHDEPMGR